MKWLRSVVQCIDATSEIIAKSICWLILVFMCITMYDVVLRYFFAAPTSWAYHLVGLLFGPLWLLAGAWLLSQDEHARMDILYLRLSPRGRAIIDLVTYTLFLFYCILVLMYGWDWWWSSFIRQEVSRKIWKPPLWPFKMWIPVGVGLMLLTGIAKYIRDFHMAITGRRL